MKGTVMRPNKRRKPTNKDFQNAIQDMMYRMTAVQSQLNALTEIFSDFLDFTNKKPKFMEYLQQKVEKDNSSTPGSVENPEVKQEELESA